MFVQFRIRIKAFENTVWLCCESFVSHFCRVKFLCRPMRWKWQNLSWNSNQIITTRKKCREMRWSSSHCAATYCKIDKNLPPYITNNVIFSMIRLELIPCRWQNCPKAVWSGFSKSVSVFISFSFTFSFSSPIFHFNIVVFSVYLLYFLFTLRVFILKFVLVAYTLRIFS